MFAAITMVLSGSLPLCPLSNPVPVRDTLTCQDETGDTIYIYAIPDQYRDASMATHGYETQFLDQAEIGIILPAPDRLRSMLVRTDAWSRGEWENMAADELEGSQP